MDRETETDAGAGGGTGLEAAAGTDTGKGTTGAVAGLRPTPPVVDRRPDRAIAAGGMIAAAALLLAGVLATLLPADARRGIWLPVHLGIAAASSVAIAAMLPFFTATLAVASPVRPAVRTLGVTLTLVGILAVAVGIAWGPSGLAVAGGVTFTAGVATVAYAALRPLARSTSPRRAVLGIAAAAALIDVACGALLGTLYAAGATRILADWGLLKPAHAWLNVLGFVGVTIVTTLVHLWPTVIGTRIEGGRSGAGTGFGWVVGPPIVAAGFVIGSDFVARTGAMVTLTGAASLAAYGIARWRVRGRWTLDLPWHRTAVGHLAAGMAWGAGGAAAASCLVLYHGASPDAWSSAVLVALGVGWIAQTIVGAWTHLIPTVGPGGPALHAAQRVVLGRAWWLRLAAWQAGTLLVVTGAVAEVVGAIVLGGVVVGLTSVASVGLLVLAIRRR